MSTGTAPIRHTAEDLHDPRGPCESCAHLRRQLTQCEVERKEQDDIIRQYAALLESQIEATQAARERYAACAAGTQRLIEAATRLAGRVRRMGVWRTGTASARSGIPEALRDVDDALDAIEASRG